MLKINLLAFNDGAIANVKVILTNESTLPTGSIDIRSPVPPGMAMVDSIPTGMLRGNQVGWIHAGLAGGRSVTFRYRVNTRGLVAMAEATAIADSQTYASPPFPIGSVTSPPDSRAHIVPDIAPVPPAT
jgi:hypothetical protein